jgi:hypothetical protein
MTDTRLPEQWLLSPKMLELSDGAWRVFTNALMWCNSQGTDGDLPSRYVKYTYPTGDSSEYVLELLSVGLFEKTENGFVLPDWVGMGQSPASQVAAYRENNRLRQQKLREKKKTPQVESVTGDVTRDVGKAPQGSDTQGEASDMKVSWPVVRIPTKESDLTIREGEIL